MVTRAQIVAEALTWQGTPFQHNQSCRGHGADCVGLVYGVFRALGCIPTTFQPEPYSQQWHQHKNEELLLNQSVKFGCVDAIGEPEPGDLLFFRFGRVCSHIGLYLGENSMIHAYFGLQRAVVQPLGGDMGNRLKRIMVVPWVAK